MNNQVQLILQSLLKYAGGFLTAKGFADSSTVEVIVAGLVALAGVAWHWWHQSTITAQISPTANKP